MNPALAPNLDFLKRFRVIAYLLVFLAILGFSYAESNPPIFILGLAGIALSWWLVETPGAKPVPRWLINLGVLGASLLLFYELVIYHQENLLLGLGHFMVAILICKLFEQKTNRDYAQILTLTLLIMVADTYLSVSLFFGLILATYLILGLYGILLFHLRFETQRALEQKLVPSEAAFMTEPHDTLRRDVRRITAVCALALLLISTVVFLIFPRGKAHDLLSNWALGATARTGFNDRVRLNDFGRLQQSDALVMEVRLEQNGINVGSEYHQPYFRGIALDSYESGNPGERGFGEHIWLRAPFTSAPEQPEKNLENGSAQLIDPQYYSELGLITQQYTLYAISGNLLFTIAPPVTISSAHFRTVHSSARDHTLLVRGTLPSPLQYSIRSAVLYKPDLAREKTFVRPGDLRSPGASPESPPVDVPEPVMRKARAVAAELAPPQGQPVPPDQVRFVADRFDSFLRKNYPYSLTYRAVDRDLDPTADFLLNRTKTGGHCEFFASAMVMMCRSLGINARMVTGFHGGEYNSLGGFYVVRGKHAHAWVEVFIPNRGWTLYDPSPAATDSGSGESSAFTRWLHELMEVVQKSWLNSVVAFDNSSRQYIFDFFAAIAENITTFLKGILADTLEGFGAIFESPAVSLPIRIAALLSMLFTLAAGAWLGRSIHRRRSSHIADILRHADRKSQRQLAQDLLFFDDLLRILARTGCRKLPEQTPREYVERLAPALRGSSADARWLIDTFYDIRYGTIRVTTPLGEQIAHALTRLRQSL